MTGVSLRAVMDPTGGLAGADHIESKGEEET